MQTLKILLLAVILLTPLFSCDDEVNPIERKTTSRQPDETLNGAFVLNNHENFASGSGTETLIRVSMTGEGDLNELGISDLKLTHNKVVDMKTGKVWVTDGQMNIRLESGSEIQGLYDYWELDNQRPKLVNISVTGGSGKYYGVYGNIEINLISRPDGKLRAGVKGSLFYGKDSTL